jgi:hypothetical protein
LSRNAFFSYLTVYCKDHIWADDGANGAASATIRLHQLHRAIPFGVETIGAQCEDVLGAGIYTQVTPFASILVNVNPPFGHVE